MRQLLDGVMARLCATDVHEFGKEVIVGEMVQERSAFVDVVLCGVALDGPALLLAISVWGDLLVAARGLIFLLSSLRQCHCLLLQ